MNSYEIANHLTKQLAVVKADLALLKGSVDSMDLKEACIHFNEALQVFEDALSDAKLQYRQVLDDVFDRFSMLSDDTKIEYITGFTGIEIFSKEDFNDFMNKKLKGNYFEMATAVSRARFSSDFNPYYDWFSWSNHSKYPLKGDQNIESLVPDRMKFTRSLIKDKAKMKALGYKDQEIRKIQNYFNT